jgi:hypothetical protein
VLDLPRCQLALRYGGLYVGTRDDLRYQCPQFLSQKSLVEQTEFSSSLFIFHSEDYCLGVTCKKFDLNNAWISEHISLELMNY